MNRMFTSFLRETMALKSDVKETLAWKLQARAWGRHAPGVRKACATQAQAYAQRHACWGRHLDLGTRYLSCVDAQDEIIAAP